MDGKISILIIIVSMVAISRCANGKKLFALGRRSTAVEDDGSDKELFQELQFDRATTEEHNNGAKKESLSQFQLGQIFDQNKEKAFSDNDENRKIGFAARMDARRGEAIKKNNDKEVRRSYMKRMKMWKPPKPGREIDLKKRTAIAPKNNGPVIQPCCG
eukprot:gene13805-15250_t